MSNSIHVIHPYVDHGSLVFDDDAVGLVKEPFVGGADVVLATLAEALCGKGWRKGFSVVFSAKPFRGYQTRMNWLREEYDGNVYFCDDLQQEGWLCPALLKYFKSPPKSIYIEIKKKG
jgi:hypothetical protein